MVMHLDVVVCWVGQMATAESVLSFDLVHDKIRYFQRPLLAWIEQILIGLGVKLERENDALFGLVLQFRRLHSWGWFSLIFDAVKSPSAGAVGKCQPQLGCMETFEEVRDCGLPFLA
jgi:hypothetical protein